MITVSDKLSVQILLNFCLKKQIKNIILSPGSRNAPLIASFTQNSNFICETIPDERSAAFIALGIAQQIKKPVALICTSGTALLNYYPAIAESYYQQVPLIIISADRPKSWINQGDGQTIIQENVFKNHCHYFVQIDDYNYNEDKLWEINRELSTAFSICENKKGPIHINMGLSEPLYNLVKLNTLPSINYTIQYYSNNNFAENEINFIKEQWSMANKKIILIGQMNYSSVINELLNKLSYDKSILIISESSSNLYVNNSISCIDRLLNSIETDALKPDIFLYLGDAIVSKRIKTYFRKHKTSMFWRVSLHTPLMDTFQNLTHSFDCDNEYFLKILLDSKNNKTEFSNFFIERQNKIIERQNEFFDNVKDFCDLTVYNKLFNKINKDSHLHLSNSSVIRYSQLFDHKNYRAIWCNRGTSGIDGSTSTALGAAKSNSKEQHYLISGDISFYYDSNAFWNNLKINNLKIIVINNCGGNIFKIIDGPSSIENFQEWFVFEHNFSIKKLCDLYGLNYFYANSFKLLDDLWDDFQDIISNGINVLEIDTRNIKNEEYLNNYFSFVKV